MHGWGFQVPTQLWYHIAYSDMVLSICSWLVRCPKGKKGWVTESKKSHSDTKLFLEPAWTPQWQARKLLKFSKLNDQQNREEKWLQNQLSIRHGGNLWSHHANSFWEPLWVNLWGIQTCLLLLTTASPPKPDAYTLILVSKKWVLQKTFHCLLFDPKPPHSVPKISTQILSNLCQPRCSKFQGETVG